MTEKRITQLEEVVAHQSASIEDLSDIVARQDRELAVLARRIEMLMQREAAREAEGGGSVPLADQRPPHW